jgi:hypothetical protein
VKRITDSEKPFLSVRGQFLAAQGENRVNLNKKITKLFAILLNICTVVSSSDVV